MSIACARYVSLSLSLLSIEILYRHSITAIICTRCIRSGIFGLEFCITDSDAHIGVYYSSFSIDRYELLQWMVSALYRSHLCDRITRSTQIKLNGAVIVLELIFRFDSIFVLSLSVSNISVFCFYTTYEILNQYI